LIENNLGEVWSLFEFLNPGLLGDENTVTLGALAEIECEPIHSRRNSQCRPAD
jgi:SNF2 family DNA or RNA helicase